MTRKMPQQNHTEVESALPAPDVKTTASLLKEGPPPKIVVVCGPTATGKTRLAVHLADHCRGEIISADSMQVYQGLVIGTAAATEEELSGVAQHLVGILPPSQSFSVAEYTAMARQSIADILEKGKRPVVCGGTGLYISSLVNGIDFFEEQPSLELRKRLNRQWEILGAETMLRKLEMMDPAYARGLHLADKKRILRALERVTLTGQTIGQLNTRSQPEASPYDVLCIGLDYPQRATLYTHIERRVDKMMQQGLLKEAEQVYLRRDLYTTAAQAIGYKEFFPYFAGEKPLDACVAALKQATRHYAKRQLTWFRRMPQVLWLHAGAEDVAQQAALLVDNFLTD